MPDNRPQPRYRGSSDKVLHGVRRSIAVQNPAAGAEWSIQVTGGRKWRILLAAATFTTSATVANRSPGTQWTDGAGVIGRQAITGNIASSTTALVGYLTGSSLAGASGAGNIVNITCPNVILGEGFTFGSLTGNIQAGDAYTAIRVWIEELFEDDSTMLIEHLAHEADIAQALGMSPPAS